MFCTVLHDVNCVVFVMLLRFEDAPEAGEAPEGSTDPTNALKDRLQGDAQGQGQLEGKNLLARNFKFRKYLRNNCQFNF